MELVLEISLVGDAIHVEGTFSPFRWVDDASNQIIDDAGNELLFFDI